MTWPRSGPVMAVTWSSSRPSRATTRRRQVRSSARCHGMAWRWLSSLAIPSSICAPQPHAGCRAQSPARGARSASTGCSAMSRARQQWPPRSWATCSGRWCPSSGRRRASATLPCLSWPRATSIGHAKRCSVRFSRRPNTGCRSVSHWTGYASWSATQLRQGRWCVSSNPLPRRREFADRGRGPAR